MSVRRASHPREGRAGLDLSSELALMAVDITGTTRPIVRRFNQLLDALEKVRARYAIIGAAAAGAHGHERFTKDIDVLVAEEDLQPLLEELSPKLRELGRTPTEGPPKQVRLRSKRAKTAAGIDIDLLVPVSAVES